MSRDGMLLASDSWLLAFAFWLFGRAQARVLGGALAPLTVQDFAPPRFCGAPIRVRACSTCWWRFALRNLVRKQRTPHHEEPPELEQRLHGG